MDLYSDYQTDFESYSYAVQVHCEAYTTPGNKVRIIERFFDVPLDYTRPYAEKIRLFARQAIPVGPSSLDEAMRPVCLYIPDFTAYDCAVALPTSYPITPAFFDRGYQVLFLDQRGTGLSTPLNSLSFEKATLQGLPLDTPEMQAEYATFFRADNIVRDAEEIRKFLLQGGRTQDDKKWTICGNAYSGFLCAVYLSLFPSGVKRAYVTAGIPPLMSDPFEVFKYVFEKAKERNALYYEMFPGDIYRVREIMSHITKGGRRGIPMKGGGFLSAERFQCLHIGLGILGGTDGMHHLFLRGANDLKIYGELSYKFMEQLRAYQGFDKNIIHSILQETVYCQG
ncbi:hypothetical protein OE88DRAFT_1019349 [Heliocybe sulcata]|uniref:AB hydrolase-1 domain-containing protein n=1 Tax=Heliocybe sulcata TaxID=5364 RepID=A0A5C3ND31_9AGAM|nr:hypothetical protein OE88DRAFT_1019349 [Heliocybe sulcata]